MLTSMLPRKVALPRPSKRFKSGAPIHAAAAMPGIPALAIARLATKSPTELANAKTVSPRIVSDRPKMRPVACGSHVLTCIWRVSTTSAIKIATRAYVRTYIHTYIHIHTCTYIHTYIYIYTIYIYIYIQTHNIHTYIHTYLGHVNELSSQDVDPSNRYEETDKRKHAVVWWRRRIF